MSTPNDHHIDISLEFRGAFMDVRVPADVSLARLKSLFDTIFEEQGIKLPHLWHFELAGKHITVGQLDYLSDFAVADGDVLSIVENTEHTSPRSVSGR